MSSVLTGITSKNRKELLRKAIQSGLEQANVINKVAVFDDNSSDGTGELAGVYPQVDWHLSKEEKGYLYARNLFLQTTEADYYCSLDDDSWFLKQDALQKAVTYMDEHPVTGALAFRILTPESPASELAEQPEETVKATNNFIGCGHLLRVDAVRKVGRYTPNPGFYGGEEKDLCIRLMDAGYSIGYFPGVTIWHEKTAVARNQQKQHRSGVCNDLVFAFRRVPGWMLLPVLLYKFFSHFRFSLFSRQTPLLAPCLQGFGDFLHFLVKGSLQRRAVKYTTYRKFLAFNKTA